jgi:triosephosphate isomerase
MRRKLIAANWKMNKRLADAAAFAAALRTELSSLSHCDLLIFPSFFCIHTVANGLAGTPVSIGAQDLYWESDGAFTGEVSAAMLADVGASHVLVGHSERRHVMGEDDAVVARKLAAALDNGLNPLLCVGETLAQRESGRESDVVRAQLDAAFDGRSAADAAKTVIAYEPVWAIGTGRNATPDDAEAMHRMIRDWLASHFSASTAAAARIQYGGSARPANAGELLARSDIDGLLVGGASLQAASFVAIARAVPGG